METEVRREARSVWQGDLTRGSGRVTRGASDVVEAMSWTGRTGAPSAQTSPEELIAAAHAGCFSMALANVLAEGGHAPDELDVRASCALDPQSLRITAIDLLVAGRVAGMDDAAFAGAVERAEHVCPVSNALRGNVAISVRPQLLAA